MILLNQRLITTKRLRLEGSCSLKLDVSNGKATNVGFRLLLENFLLFQTTDAGRYLCPHSLAWNRQILKVSTTARENALVKDFKSSYMRWQPHISS
ncbi:hypothetical protein Y032_0007g3407 [Ancylostoma ceylanicum]|uniref:Uncharacterized protein n=1 Tax=Ancylostoma ceylanicum TaxID=53326 RepID=A0A016VN63_9BILA|nr:hypothetical protein Y032_0007g3407 [Ancylostoma ceylanicum]